MSSSDHTFFDHTSTDLSISSVKSSVVGTSRPPHPNLLPASGEKGPEILIQPLHRGRGTAIGPTIPALSAPPCSLAWSAGEEGAPPPHGLVGRSTPRRGARRRAQEESCSSMSEISVSTSELVVDGPDA